MPKIGFEYLKTVPVYVCLIEKLVWASCILDPQATMNKLNKLTFPTKLSKFALTFELQSPFSKGKLPIYIYIYIRDISFTLRNPLAENNIVSGNFLIAAPENMKMPNEITHCDQVRQKRMDLL